MPPPSVFISYSRTCPRSPTIARALYERLAAIDVRPIWDERTLEVGEYWRDDLVEALGTCEAAVLILSPETVRQQKPWVLQEATILKFRHDFSGEIGLYPVLIDGLDVTAVTGEFGALALPDIQAFAGSDDAVVGDIIAKVKAGRARWALDGPESEILLAMRGLLRALPIEALANIGKALDKEVKFWTPSERLKNILAHDVARLLRKRGTSAQDVAEALVRNDIAMERNTAFSLLDLAVLSWVPKKAAEMLRQRVATDAAFVVNGERHDFTPEKYVGRAACSLSGWLYQSVSLRVGELEGPEIKERIRSALAKKLFGRRPPDEVSLADISQRLRSKPDPPCFVHLEALPRPDVLAELLADAELDGLRFLLLAADCKTPGHPPCPPATLVEPALGDGEEAKAYDSYDAAWSRLNAAQHWKQ